MKSYYKSPKLCQKKITNQIIQFSMKNLDLSSCNIETYSASFPTNLILPARVFGGYFDNNTGSADKNIIDSKALNTSHEFLHHKLIETGLRFDHNRSSKWPFLFKLNEGEKQQTLREVTDQLSKFVHYLQLSGCYDSIQLRLQDNNRDQVMNTNDVGIDIYLQEKKWYKVHVGGGLKDSKIIDSGKNLFLLPTLKFEFNAMLINLSGVTDISSFSYSLDQTSTPSYTLQHARPLFSIFSKGSVLRDFILRSYGTQASFTARINSDTYNFENVRSCKENHQSMQLSVSSSSDTTQPNHEVSWSFCNREIIPRRHTSLPYACNSTHEICRAVGPNSKHSFSYKYLMNGSKLDKYFCPTKGFDARSEIELAGPPGDVGFLKLWFGSSYHFSFLSHNYVSSKENLYQNYWYCKIIKNLALHNSFNGGMIFPLSFNGMCNRYSSRGGLSAIHVSDRFYIGGPMQLRGFLNSGIGPRSMIGGTDVSRRDSLGGDMYYTTLLAASVPFLSKLYDGIRLFCFINAGTLTGLDCHTDNYAMVFLKSSRISFGGGVSIGTSIGRLEATYAIPYRFGGRDTQKFFQIGLGLNFG